MRATHTFLKAIARPRRGGSQSIALRTAIFCRIKWIDKACSRIPGYRVGIVKVALLEFATGHRTCLYSVGSTELKLQLVLKDLRMSGTRDEVHNSGVEECNLISSRVAVFFESRYSRAQTRRSITTM